MNCTEMEETMYGKQAVNSLQVLGETENGGIGARYPRLSSSSTTQPPSPRLCESERLLPVLPSMQAQKEASKVLHTTGFDSFAGPSSHNSADGQATETESQPSSPVCFISHPSFDRRSPPATTGIPTVNTGHPQGCRQKTKYHGDGTLGISKIHVAQSKNIDSNCKNTTSSKIRGIRRVPNKRSLTQSQTQPDTCKNKASTKLKTKQSPQGNGNKLEHSGLHTEGNHSLILPLIPTSIQQRHLKGKQAQNITKDPSAQSCPPLEIAISNQLYGVDNLSSLPPLPNDDKIKTNTNSDHTSSKVKLATSTLQKKIKKKTTTKTDQAYASGGHVNQHGKDSQTPPAVESTMVRKDCTKRKASGARCTSTVVRKGGKFKALNTTANTESYLNNNNNASRPPPKKIPLPSNTTKKKDHTTRCEMRNCEKPSNTKDGQPVTTLSPQIGCNQLPLKSAMTSFPNKNKSVTVAPNKKEKSTAGTRANRKALKKLDKLPTGAIDAERNRINIGNLELVCTNALQGSAMIDMEQGTANESILKTGTERAKTLYLNGTGLGKSEQPSMDVIVETEPPRNGSDGQKKKNVVPKQRRKRATQDCNGLNTKSCRRKICQQIELQRDNLIKDCIMKLIEQSSSVVSHKAGVGIEDLKVPRVIQGMRALTAIRVVGAHGMDCVNNSIAKGMMDWSDKWVESCIQEGMDMIRRQMWMFKTPDEEAVKFITSIFKEVAIWLLDYTSKKHALAEQVANEIIGELDGIGQDLIAGRLDEKWTDVVCDHFLNTLFDWFDNHRDHNSDKAWQLVDTLLEQVSKLGRECQTGISSGVKMVQVGRRQILTTSLTYLRCTRYSAQDPTIRPLRIKDGHVDPLSLRFALICGSTTSN